jgi:hypothetical protein
MNARILIHRQREAHLDVVGQGNVLDLDILSVPATKELDRVVDRLDFYRQNRHNCREGVAVGNTGIQRRGQLARGVALPGLVAWHHPHTLHRASPGKYIAAMGGAPYDEFIVVKATIDQWHVAVARHMVVWARGLDADKYREREQLLRDQPFCKEDGMTMWFGAGTR